MQKFTFTLISRIRAVQPRVNPRTTARPGDKIKLALDMTKLHLFDKDTELVIPC